MGYNSRWDDDDDYRPQHTTKRKRERKQQDAYAFGNSGSNKKCKQCANKHSCDQSNAQRCKRFSKSRNYEDYDA